MVDVALRDGARSFAAVDLGAESGRVALGRFDGAAVTLEVMHRFETRAVRLPSGLHPDLLGVFAHSVNGLSRVATDRSLSGIGVDAWGVDYALLDGRLRVLGLPFHYRDSRTDGVVEQVHDRISRSELYSITGIQTMPINTIFQLASELDRPLLALAERIALIPDLIGLWLTGKLANESTVASTSGLLDASTGQWAHSVVHRLGFPLAPFAVDPVEPGCQLGPVLRSHEPLGGVPVWQVASHDTASAFLAAPLAGSHEAVISSGTWSLVGVETAEPVLDDEAAALNFTNERGALGTVRLLRNVMGLWLLQECRRAWDATSSDPSDYQHLVAQAESASGDVALFDPDDESLRAPTDMPAAIAALCRRRGQSPPELPGEFVRSILVSLACKYRFVLDRLAALTDIRIDLIRVIGGGARNALLCQLTADVTERTVVAGPVEATAMGNILMQLIAAGELRPSLAELRAVAAASSRTTTFEPSRPALAAEIYGRFLRVSGLKEQEASSHLAVPDCDKARRR